MQSRRKEVERLQTTDWRARTSQRPYIKFTQNRPSGRLAMECSDVAKAHDGVQVIRDFDAIVNRGEQIVLVGRNGLGKTTLLKALLADAPGQAGGARRHRRRRRALGSRSVDRLLRRRTTPARSRRA